MNLKEYLETEIIPRYESFDGAHRREHVEYVICQSLTLAGFYDVNPEMVLAIAAYHDTGLAVERKTHHLESGRIVREDANLLRWFSPEQIETMAQAVEDHRGGLAQPGKMGRLRNCGQRDAAKNQHRQRAVAHSGIGGQEIRPHQSAANHRRCP